jgi:hypothetical protein
MRRMRIKAAAAQRGLSTAQDAMPPEMKRRHENG